VINLSTVSYFAPQLLTSASIYIRDHKHNTLKCRALLDTCATANFITESVVRRLGIPVVNQSIPIGLINATSTHSKGMVQITIQSMYDNFCKTLTCLTVPTIMDSIPAEIFPRSSIKIPSNIRLADPEFHMPRSIDLLIGSGASLSLFAVGQINLSHREGDLFLQKTRLGWVVTGSASSQGSSRAAKCNVANLETQLIKFWETEEIIKEKPKSDEELKCEAHFLKNVSRDGSGRYIVRLPFRETDKQLGESRAVALKRLSSLERKLNANETLKTEYDRIMKEYMTLNYTAVINDDNKDGYYMPHHAVFKESSNTTKIRVVFDASAETTNGLSLNDMLMIGPTIQPKIFAHLLRFRTYNYVLTADIEKMYCQILIHEDDRQYQKILWRINEKIETLQLNTLTFGVSSSPYLAIRTIHKLADDEYHVYPRAARILKTHLYVDDLLTGAETIEDARAIRDEIIALLSRGGFTIRQWASNDERIVKDLSTGALHANFVLEMDRSLKTLGIIWNARDDKICYVAHPINIMKTVTKRNILSEIAKIFDPLGLMGPVVFYAKRLMQDVWRCKLHWDESVPQNIFTSWVQFVQQLQSMGKVLFERKLFAGNDCDVQLHGFCDASNSGYGACFYVRSRDKKGNKIIRLISAKSRVAPLKTITIPRLELCGALLLAQLYHETFTALGINPSKVIF